MDTFAMHTLEQIAEPFVNMAHSIVWASGATVDSRGRPRSRVLHPIWEWDGARLVGWIATDPTSLKRKHLDANPFLSLNYWATNQDTCTAECRTSWLLDDDSCRQLWDRFKQTPEPVGYDPAIIPQWNDPTDASFGALRVEPWRLRVFPGSVLMGKGGEIMTWKQS